MSPVSETIPSDDKCRSSSSDTNKTTRFSFRWFLKRSKSSKSAKEMAQTESRKSNNVRVSKSCDSGMAGMDKCSTFLLWKLLPSRGKVVKPKPNNQSRAFKMSFSCSDVSGIHAQSKAVSMARSTYNIPTSIVEVPRNTIRHASPSSSSLFNNNNNHKRVGSVDCLGQLDRDFVPDVFQLVLCKLCLSMIPVQKMFTLDNCGCSFCHTCMHQYLFINIKEGNVAIMCPDADCPSKGKLLVPEIQEIVGDDIFYMFQKFKLNNDVESDPYRMWCPTPGCETICRFQPPSTTNTGISVFCLNCKLTFCSSCKLRWHSGKTCEDMKLILQEEEDFNMSDDEGATIKRCPNCRVPIERDEGCAQMMCKRCKHVFCWHCLASLDDDFLLRHYDKGPCRNKLGHSRASMVWHRTQVVGIFAGFSFLLLVASPVLLLAAPCLLCCRCKNCKLLNEEATLL